MTRQALAIRSRDAGIDLLRGPSLVPVVMHHAAPRIPLEMLLRASARATAMTKAAA